MSKSTTPVRGQKPSPDFPLTWHQRAGKWCKRVGPKFYYFTDDAGESLRQWLLHKSQFERGIDPRKELPNAVTVRMGCNQYLTELKLKQERDEVGPRRFVDMRGCCEMIVESMGGESPLTSIGPQHFTRLRQYIATRKKSPITLGNELVRVKTVFKWLVAHGKAPSDLRYGPDFSKPSAKVVRQHEAGKEFPTFSRNELRAILLEAPTSLVPMILLGLSAGFGPTDIAMLPNDVDFTQDFLTIPRQKTAIDRRIWVWPELRDSIAAYKRLRPQIESVSSDRFFLRADGRPWGNESDASAITERFTAAQRRAKVYRHHRSFYGLRHTMLSIATGANDPLVEKLLMGHVRSDITERYRHTFPDDRIRKVSEFVRSWLFQGEEASQ